MYYLISWFLVHPTINLIFLWYVDILGQNRFVYGKITNVTQTIPLSISSLNNTNSLNVKTFYLLNK